jgi:hypothetical protein
MYRLADQSCCGIGFMAPDLLSAPNEVTLPGPSLTFPFGEPLLLPIKTVPVFDRLSHVGQYGSTVKGERVSNDHLVSAFLILGS